MVTTIDRSRFVSLNYDFDSSKTKVGKLGNRTVRLVPGRRADFTRVPTRRRNVSLGERFVNFFYGKQKLARLNYKRALSSYSKEVNHLVYCGMSRKGGKVDAQALVSSLNSLRAQSKTILKLGAHHSCDEILQARLSKTLGKLTNEQLLSVYQGTLSEDMLRFRLGLSSAGSKKTERLLGDLNTYEAMVNTELLQRIDSGEQNQPMIKGRMSLKQLEILADVSRDSAKDRLEVQSHFSTKDKFAIDVEDPRIKRHLEETGLTVSQFTDGIRKAQLTINFKPEVWFNEDSTVLEAQTYQNLWQRGRKPDLMTDSYAKHRDFVERETFEPLKEGKLQSQNRPLYAGLNVGRNVLGTTALYGEAYLVLKPNVKKRCTYSAQDSFLLFDYKISEKGTEKFSNGIQTLLKSLTQKTRKTFTEEKLKQISKNLERLQGTTAGLHSDTEEQRLIWNEILDLEHVESFHPDDTNKIEQFFKRCFVVEGSSKLNVTSYDRLERILQSKTESERHSIYQMGRGVKDRSLLNLRVGNYIEAQIHGEIDFSKDVAKIVVPDDMPKKQMERAMAFAMKHGIKLVTCKYDNINLEHHPKIPAPEKTLPERPQTRRTSLECVSFPDSEKMKSRGPDLDFQSFRKTELPEILKIYANHENTFDPEGLHGRMHICRSLIYSRVLSKVLQKKGVNVNTNLLYRAVAFHDSGRQKNGTDYWEQDSAKLLKQHLQNKEVENETFLNFANNCIVKKSKQPTKPTVEQGLLQSVDSLDIMRLPNIKENYDRNMLWFMKGDLEVKNKVVRVDSLLRERLISEISQFIDLTEPPLESDKWLEAKQESGELKHEDFVTYRKKREKELKERHESISNEEYLPSLEKKLLANREKLPLLYKYYFTEEEVTAYSQTKQKTQVQEKENVKEPKKETKTETDTQENEIIEEQEEEQVLELNLNQSWSINGIRQAPNTNTCYLLSTLAAVLNTSWGEETLRGMVQEDINSIVVSFANNRQVRLDKDEVIDPQNTNAPWVQIIEKACTRRLNKSMRELGMLTEIPNAFGWPIEQELPEAWTIDKVLFGNMSQQQKLNTAQQRLRTTLTQALENDRAVTFMRHGHAIALQSINNQNNQLTFYDSLTGNTRIYSFEQLAGLLVSGEGQFAIINRPVVQQED